MRCVIRVYKCHEGGVIKVMHGPKNYFNINVSSCYIFVASTGSGMCFLALNTAFKH